MSNEEKCHQRRRLNLNSDEADNESPALSELRLVLLGRTGAGKSATGNTVLGKKSFNVDLSMSSVTKECRRESETVDGRKITVLDTPDFLETDQALRKLQCCLALSFPGPHAFLLVIPMERYTEEQKCTVELILEMFNEEITRHTILIFSHADKLRGENIREFISRQKPPIQELVERFGRRLVAFDNTNIEQDQVKRLLDEVEKLLEQNQNQYFSNEDTDKAKKMMEEAKKIIEEKRDTAMAERKRKIKKEVRKLADDRWFAFTASLNEEKKETERKKKRLQDMINHIEVDINKEVKNAQAIPARLKRFRSNLEREQKNMRKLQNAEIEEETERTRRKATEEKDLKIWIQEEEQRRLREAGQNDTVFSDNHELHLILIFLLGLVVGLAFVLCVLMLRDSNVDSKSWF